MNQTDKLREILKGAPPGGYDAATLREKTGIEKPINAMRSMINTREVAVHGTGRKHTYALEPNWTPSPRLAPRRRRGRKNKSRKGPGTKRPYRRLLKNVTRRVDDDAALRALALENFVAATAQLRTAVRDCVDGADDDPVLSAAIANHDRAARLFHAARPQ